MSPDSGRVSVTFTLNGEPRTIEVGPSDRLLDTLRNSLGLPGTKEGCGEGECGACTVLFDGLPANSCLVLAVQARGHDVRTVESLTDDDLATMTDSGATQCGACSPGVAMTARWVCANPGLLAGYDVRELMAGNLCRCTGYDGILEGLAQDLEKGGSGR